MSAERRGWLLAALLAFCMLGCVPFCRAGTMTQSPVAQQDAGLAASCASCHRADGQSSAIPVIAGMDESRMLQRMAAYRLQPRGDQIMHVIATSLTPAETAQLARYFARQRPGASLQ